MSDALARAAEATWPPARMWAEGAWTYRDGAGGGKRVSAATARGPVGARDIDALQAAMAGAPLVRVSEGEVALDALLAGAGYAIADPTLIYAAPLAALAWPGAAEAHWPWPDEAAAIWDEGGIGPARRAVMTRAEGPKTALLARLEGAPAATAFLALHEGVAMIHALETRPAFRRRGAARAILGAARAWAGARGARTFALAVTERNKAARALYISLGLAVAGSYHYRMKPVLP